MSYDPIVGWTEVRGPFGAIEHPWAIGFSDDGERLVAIDHGPTAWVTELRDGEVVGHREDGTEEWSEADPIGYPECDGRSMRYSSFRLQELPITAHGGWQLELRKPATDDCGLYLHGPVPTHRILHLGAGWETFIGGFSPCGRYLALRDFGCLALYRRQND